MTGAPRPPGRGRDSTYRERVERYRRRQRQDQAEAILARIPSGWRWRWPEILERLGLSALAQLREAVGEVTEAPGAKGG